MERRLIEYLPFIVRERDVLKTLMEAEQPEFEAAWNTFDGLLSEQFVITAESVGLAKWEQLLQITADSSDTVDTRRDRVLARLNEKAMYTLPWLRSLLRQMFGAGNSDATVKAGTYILNVRIEPATERNLALVSELLERIIPQNMVYRLYGRYNTHAELRPYTHELLCAYAQEQLRNEVLYE